MASLDIYRPAAMGQLAVLGRDLDIPLCRSSPARSRRRSRAARLEAAKLGRLHWCCSIPPAGTTLDEERLMKRRRPMIKNRRQPAEVLLVADSLTARTRFNLARSFDERVAA